MEEQHLNALKAISQSNRLKILQLIAENGEINALKILDFFNISQPTLSHHMKILSNAKLINTRIDGLWSYYSLNINTIEEIQSIFSKLTGTAVVADVKAAVKPESIVKKKSPKTKSIDIALL